MPLCDACKKINTFVAREDGRYQCSSCSNSEYLQDKMEGRIVELKIDMRKVKQSTLMQIKALIQKDIENHE